MVISHKYKYVFVELPRTGSTAISAELVKNYAGEPILEKHSRYKTFLRTATAEEKTYKVVSGIRNPLDDAVSRFEKYRRRAESIRQTNWFAKKRCEFIEKTDGDYSKYLRRYYRMPYDNWANSEHRNFDLIIRFEDIQGGLSKFAEMIGVDLVRELPVKNKTKGKKAFESYYPPSLVPHAVWVFGPYMRDWGYEFPDSWDAGGIPRSSQLLYSALSGPRGLYWSHVRHPDARLDVLLNRVFAVR